MSDPLPAATGELRDGDLVLRPTRSTGGFDGFAVLVDDERVGSVALREESAGVRSARWNLGTGPDAMTWAVRTLRLVFDHTFGELGATRVEARVPVDRTADIRAASIAGMRREGVLRGGSDADRVLVARLADDPPLDSRDAFIAILNAGLPTKRVISQGLVRDPAGRVLMCELTYKTEWDLPGGVIEVGESPAVGLVRELSEELGVTVEVRGLLTVTWLPAWRGWDDACMFLFDLGVAEPEIVDTFDLQANEIAAVHWCTPDDLSARATAASQEMLRHVREGTVTAYRDAPLAP